MLLPLLLLRLLVLRLGRLEGLSWPTLLVAYFPTIHMHKILHIFDSDGIWWAYPCLGTRVGLFARLHHQRMRI